MSKQVDSSFFHRKRRIPAGLRDNYWARKHNMTDTPIYYVWCAMKQRCYNKNNPRFYCYGKKGIVICDDWKNDFSSFFDWAVNNGYKEGLTIDRIDVNGNYCPENCRWATYKEQNNNFSRNVNIEYNGTIMSISAWAEKLNIERNTLAGRLKKGWSIEKALTTPVNKFYRRNYKHEK